MKFFIDANIIISAALFPKGKTARVFSYILESHEVIISTFTIEECKTVFSNKFPNKYELLQKFFDRIQFELFLSPAVIDVKAYPRIRDHKDLPVLASAILSEADILLTGDKDFSDIDIKKPLIFTPSDYFDLIDK